MFNRFKDAVSTSVATPEKPDTTPTAESWMPMKRGRIIDCTDDYEETGFILLQLDEPGRYR